MARIRTIKPEFFTDERIGECSVTARLLFVACWVIADDNGNLERSARQVKAQAFPYDSFDCEPLLLELIDRGLLIEYEVEGKKCLHIRGFGRHQRIDKPSKPRLPLYEGSESPLGVFGDSSPSTPISKGREGKGEEGRETGHRVPDGPVAEHIPLADGSEHPVLEAQVVVWKRLFPALDVPAKLREIRAWNLANPRNRKTAKGVERHIVGWLTREQDRARTQRAGSPQRRVDRRAD